jgi:hypothetical protein
MPSLNETDDLRRQLDQDGFAVVPGLMTQDDVLMLQARVDGLFESTRPKSKQVLYVNGQVPVGTPPLDDMLHQWLNPHLFGRDEGTSELLEKPRTNARQLLDAEPVLFQDLLLIKEPGQNRFPWHQDFPFWPVDRPDAVVCWIPLVPSDVQGGGLRFARGSHRLGAQPVIDLHRGTRQDRSETPHDLDGEFETVCPRLQPGDAVFFSPLVFHSSAPRSSPGRRAAWSSIWMHPSVRWSHQRAPAHPICKRVLDGGVVGELAG